MSARKGKVARLPKAERDIVNLMLLDGATAERVIARLVADGFGAEWLAKEGFEDGGWNEQNISNWREGGYAEWLKQNERLEQMKLQRESALELVRDNEGSKVTEAALHLAAAQAYDVLATFDLSGFKDLLKKEPALYGKVTMSLAKLSHGVLDMEKFRAHVLEQKRKIETALAAGKSKGGITDETIELIERELKLL